jgi:oligoribonuclease (3'-5' exoribonuclease)
MTIDVMKKYDNSFIIAGANCWFDLAFIEQYMPKLYSCIPDKINHFDVSAMEKYACMKGHIIKFAIIK